MIEGSSFVGSSKFRARGMTHGRSGNCSTCVDREGAEAGQSADVEQVDGESQQHVDAAQADGEHDELRHGAVLQQSTEHGPGRPRPARRRRSTLLLLAAAGVVGVSGGRRTPICR